MRILFLSGHYPPHTSGGGEISTHYIARGLHEQGETIDVIAEGEEKEYDLDGVHVALFPLGLVDKPLFEEKKTKIMAQRLKQILSERTPYDVIHAHDFRSALVLSELKTKAKKVVTIRDYAAISGDTNNFLRNKTTPNNPLSIASILRSHRIAEVSFPRNVARMLQYILNVKYRQEAFSSLPYRIYISKAQQEIIEEHIDPATQTDVIYNPVQPDFLATSPQPGKAFEVLYLGRIEMYKGVDLLLETWPAIIQKYPEAKLRLVGEGASIMEYQRLVEKLQIKNSVQFSGRISWDALQKVYDSASIIVAPHRWIEPFGRTVVEAMARGKIVIAAKSGGPSEILQDGKTGFFFTPGSSKELEKTLIKALAFSYDERGKIGLLAQNWVKEHLNTHIITHQYISFYNRIASNTM